MDTKDSTVERTGLWKTLNSPFILLIIGFIFTTILGGLLTSYLNRSAHEREIRLKAQLDESARQQEIRLKTFARQQEIRFVRLHEERAGAIKSLHDKLIDVEKSLFNLLYSWRPIGIAPERVKPEDVVTAVRNFRKDAEKSKVYFDAEFSSVLDSLCENLESTMRSLEESIMKSGYTWGEDPWKGEPPDFPDKAWEGVHVRVVKAKEQLRSQFRHILGVQ